MGDIHYAYQIEDKAETAAALVERFRNTINNKPFVRMDMDGDKVKYLWFDTYDEAIASSIGLATPNYHPMCIVSKDDCVFLDEV